MEGIELRRKSREKEQRKKEKQEGVSDFHSLHWLCKQQQLSRKHTDRDARAIVTELHDGWSLIVVGWMSFALRTHARKTEHKQLVSAHTQTNAQVVCGSCVRVCEN